MPLVLKTVSDSKDAQQDLAKLKESVNNIEKSVQTTTSSLGNMVKALSGIFATGLALKQLTTLADTFTNLRNRIKAVTETQEDAENAFANISRIAIETRSDLTAVAKLYSKIAINSKDIGISQKDAFKATQAFGQSLKLTGASAAEANGALTQFGQAVGSGNLAGDELKSLLENNVLIAKVIAENMGVRVGDLKKMGEQGLLSTTDILKAILKGADELDTKFKSLDVTFEDAFANLGTSLQLLFDTAKTNLFGSSSFITTWINNLARGIFSVSRYFSHYLLLMKASVFFFVLDTIDLFKGLWDTFKKTAVLLYDVFGNLMEQITPGFKETTKAIKDWAFGMLGVVAGVLVKMSKDLLNTNFVSSFIENIKIGIVWVKTFVATLAETLGFKFPTIDVSKYIKDLQPMLDLVRNWVKTIEGYFYWLYDKVIGRSWIPDLVLGVISWLGRLGTNGLNHVKDFTSKAATYFKDLYATVSSKAPVKQILNMKSALLSMLGVKKTVAVAVAGIGAAGVASTGITSDIAPNTPKSLNVFQRFTKTLKDFVDQRTREGRENRETSIWGRTLKQVLGRPDQVPGEIFGKQIDVNSNVGRGPLRYMADRPFGHDVIAALPDTWQLPAVAAITGVFALGIAAAFEAGPVRTVLLSLVTTLGGLAAAKIIPDANIKNTFGEIALFFTNLIEKGITAIFGGNVIKDPLGLLGVLAKTAILFAAGREMLLAAGAAILKAPTNAGKTVDQFLNQKVIEAAVKKNEQALKQLPKTNIARETAESLRRTVNEIARGKDNTGRRIGVPTAMQAIDPRNFANNRNPFNDRRLDTLVAAAAATATKLDKQIKESASNELKRAAFQKSLNTNNTKLDTIRTELRTATNAFKQGVKNTTATAGGIIGGVAGFQLGSAIANNMGENTPAWKKVGIQIAAAVSGQALGSGIGAVMASVFMGIVSFAFKRIAMVALLSPMVTGVLLLASAFVAGFALLKSLPEAWKESLFKDKGTNSLREALLPGYIQSEAEAKDKGQEIITLEEFGSRVKGNTAGDYWTGALNAIREKVIDLIPAAGKGVTTQGFNTVETFTTTLQIATIQLVEFAKRLILPIPRATQPTVNKASGGYISGPGTGTSDSIPAMLSNGEFVINAKSTARNKSLLEQINSGKVAKFAKGGYVDKFGLDNSASKILGAVQSKPLYQRFDLDRVIMKSEQDDYYFTSLDNLSKFMIVVPSITQSKDNAEAVRNYATNLHEIGHADDFAKKYDFIEKRVDPKALAERSFGDLVTLLYSMINFSDPGRAETYGGRLLAEATASDFASRNSNLDDDQAKVFKDRLSGALMTYILADARRMKLNPYATKVIEESKWFNKKAPIISGDDGNFAGQLARDARLEKPIKRSLGGLIVGPGTGTSDDIPTLLSNGEFVVNAAATKQNRKLLEGINSGKLSMSNLGMSGDSAYNVPMLGGEVRTIKIVGDKLEFKISDPNSILGRLEEYIQSNVPASVRDAFGGMLDFAKNVLKDLGKAAGFKNAKPPGVGPALEPKGFEQRLEEAKGLSGAVELLTNGLRDAGLAVDKAALEKAIETDPDIANRIAASLEKIARANRVPAGTFGSVTAQNFAGEFRADIQNLLRSNNIAATPDSKWATKSVKGDPLKLEDQLKVINEAFPKVALTMEDFVALSDDIRESYYGEARASVFRLKQSLETPIGPLSGVGRKQPKVADELQAANKERENREERVLEDISSRRSPFAAIKKDLQDYNVNATEDIYNLFDETQRSNIKAKIGSIKASRTITQAPLNDPNVTVQARADEADNITREIEALTLMFDRARKDIGRSYKNVNSQLQEFGLEIEKGVFNNLTSLEVDTLKGIIKDLRQANDNLSAARSELDKQAAQKQVVVATKQFNDFRDARVDDSQKVGEDFARTTLTTFASGFSNFLKDKRDEGKSSAETFGKYILDNVTNGIIDTFVNGLVKALTTSFPKIQSSLGDLGKGVFGLGKELMPKDKSAGASFGVLQSDENSDSATPPANMDFSKLFDNLGTKIVSAYDSASTGVMDFFKNIIVLVQGIWATLTASTATSAVNTGTSWIGTAIGMAYQAEGGYISGPGTSISDSIPAMLSNGEFVINAKSTKAFMPLLESINSGKAKKFATGGLVGSYSPSIMTTPDTTVNNTTKSSQVVNVQITGDISRQTRREIYEMLPQIASGVNMQNKERGYKA